MSRNYSELTFNKLTKDLGFIKVFWNGKLIFDDTADLPLVDLNTLYDEYGNRYIYSMQLKVVEGHHCELKIKGETDKQYTPRQLVVGPYFISKDVTLYEHDYVDDKDITLLEKVEDVELKKELLEELKNLEYTYNRPHEVYRVKVRNLDKKYGWIRTCKEHYILKEINKDER